MDMQVRVSQTCEGCKYAKVVHPSAMPEGTISCEILNGRLVAIIERECTDEQWREGQTA